MSSDDTTESRNVYQVSLDDIRAAIRVCMHFGEAEFACRLLTVADDIGSALAALDYAQTISNPGFNSIH